MVGFYICVAIFIGLIAIGGFESTMRLVHYADLSIRYAIIQVRMYLCERN